MWEHKRKDIVRMGLLLADCGYVDCPEPCLLGRGQSCFYVRAKLTAASTILVEKGGIHSFATLYYIR